MIKSRYTILLFVVTLLVSCKPGGDNTATPPSKPNIIYILADDLGYGDLSSYGQTKFETPNIDKLAENGIRFTQHYSGSTVCAPSRSSLLTGQHTGQTPIRGNKEIMPEGQHPMPASAITVAEVLKEAGYTTGAFGKWGLGFTGSEGDPNNQGFDEFYGYNCQRQAHRYYPEHIWHNSEKVIMPGNDWSNTVTYAQDLIQEKTLEFIENNKDNNFFAYVPILIPHAELLVPDDSIFALYDGKYEETPFVGSEGADYGPGLKVGKYCSQEKPRATFAAMVHRMDLYVGQIAAKLEALGIADNTIIMFSSDNGPHQEGGADPEFFNSNGNLRGYKRDMYEGGIRTAFIVHWPEKIKEGRESDHISAFWDVLPTCAELAGAETPEGINGISMVPEIINEGEQAEHDYLYWEFHEHGGKQAVRKGNWKAVRLKVKKDRNAPLELYDLSTDEGEQNNIAKQHPEIVAEMVQIMNEARTDSPLFNFGSKTFKGD